MEVAQWLDGLFHGKIKKWVPDYQTSETKTGAKRLRLADDMLAGSRLHGMAGWPC
jgi:hypothetical protein